MSPVPQPSVGPHLPWWLSQGIGAALALVVGAVVWVSAWDIAAYVSTPTAPAAQRYGSAEVAEVAGTTGATGTTGVAGDALAPASATGMSTDQRPAAKRRARSAAGAGAELGRWRPTLVKPALSAEALQRREQARIRRARRSDMELAAFIRAARVQEAAGLWVKPINAAYRITATFGESGPLWSRDHTGVDLAAPSGTPVLAVSSGTVTQAGRAGAYGLRVEVTHPDGTVTSYSHLSRIDVTAGEAVAQGTPVAAVGATGNVTGPHLHLELETPGGVKVDPVKALAARGVRI